MNIDLLDKKIHAHDGIGSLSFQKWALGYLENEKKNPLRFESKYDKIGNSSWHITRLKDQIFQIQ